MFDGFAYLTEVTDQAMGKKQRQPLFVLGIKVNTDGSTTFATRAEADGIVRDEPNTEVIWRDKNYTDAAGKDWGGASGDSKWRAVIDPETRVPRWIVSHSIQTLNSRDGRDYQQRIPTKEQAGELTARAPGVTARWRNRFTDPAGKDWGVVDGRVDWGLYKNPAGTAYRIGHGWEFTNLVAKNGDTRPFTPGEAEALVAAGGIVRVQGRGQSFGWTPASPETPAEQIVIEPDPTAAGPDENSRRVWVWVVLGTVLLMAGAASGLGLVIYLRKRRLAALDLDDCETLDEPPRPNSVRRRLRPDG